MVTSDVLAEYNVTPQDVLCKLICYNMIVLIGCDNILMPISTGAKLRVQSKDLRGTNTDAGGLWVLGLIPGWIIAKTVKNGARLTHSNWGWAWGGLDHKRTPWCPMLPQEMSQMQRTNFTSLGR